MKRRSKIILYLVVVCIIIGIIIGWCQYNKEHRNVKDSTGVKTTAIDLYNSFLKDSTKAKTTFTGNIVEVTGEVTQLNKNQQNQPVILLKTATQDASINCTMEGTVVNIKPGDKISVKGICTGYINGDADMGIPGDVILIRCYTTN